jgi:hypothetical protein
MRSNLARGRPTWWVILAVALALMALVAATATRSSSAGSAHRPRTDASATTTTTTKGATGSTTVPTLGGVTAPGGTSGLSGLGTIDQGSVTHPTATSTTVAAAAPTTSTTQAPSTAGTSYPGFLQPPQDSSATYGFTGQGSTRISATWSDATYLTLNVTCSGFNQSTGGSSALSMQVPDAQGACQAILSETASETDTLSYTLVIDPNGT